MKRFKVAVVVVVLVAVVLVGVSVPALASPVRGGQVIEVIESGEVVVVEQEGGEVPELAEALAMLATAAGTLVAGGVISLFLEQKAAWFQRLDKSAKWGIVFGASVFLSIAAQLIKTYVPHHVLQALEPYWQIIGGAALLWFGSQSTHLLQKIAQRLKVDEWEILVAEEEEQQPVIEA